MTEPSGPTIDRLATPAERLGRWVEDLNNPDLDAYWLSKLNDFIRISMEVEGPTFPIHGTMAPRDITEKFITGMGDMLRAQLRQFKVPADEISEIDRQVLEAQNKLYRYAVGYILHTMQNATNAFWASDIERMSGKAVDIFTQIRKYGTFEQGIMPALTDHDADTIIVAKKRATLISITRDIDEIMQTGTSLDQASKKMLRSRVCGNLEALAKADQTPQTLENIEMLRESIDLGLGIAAPPATRRTAIAKYLC